MNKLYWSIFLDVFYIVFDFYFLWIVKYEMDWICNFKFIGILYRFVFMGFIFCLFFCLKICVDFKECVVIIICRFFFFGGNGM